MDITHSSNICVLQKNFCENINTVIKAEQRACRQQPHHSFIRTSKLKWFTLGTIFNIENVPNWPYSITNGKQSVYVTPSILATPTLQTKNNNDNLRLSKFDRCTSRYTWRLVLLKFKVLKLGKIVDIQNTVHLWFIATTTLSEYTRLLITHCSRSVLCHCWLKKNSVYGILKYKIRPILTTFNYSILF